MRKPVDHNPGVAERQCFLPQINKAMLGISWTWEAEFYLQAGRKVRKNIRYLGSPEVTPGAYPE